MRVCDIVQFHSPISGGIRRYITDKAMMLRDFPQVSHCVVVPGPEDLRWSVGATEYYQIKSPLIPGSKSYRSFTQPGRIREALNQFKPDLIEVADPYQGAWTAINWAKQRDARVMLFYHSDYPRAWHRTIRKWGPPLAATGFQRLVDRYLRSVFSRANALLVSTEKYERYWRPRLDIPVLRVKLGFDPRKFHPVHDCSWVRDSIGVSAEQPLILFLGRLAREKRIPLLIEAFGKLKSKRPDAELLIVGDGEEHDSLQNLCKRKGLKVHWLPYSGDVETLASYYSAANVYAHPARHETFGFSVIESLACGTPVVAFHQSGLEEACRNSTASVLVREGDIDGFAAGMLQALERGDARHSRLAMHRDLLSAASLDTAITRLLNAYLTVHYQLPESIHRAEA